MRARALSQRLFRDADGVARLEVTGHLGDRIARPASAQEDGTDHQAHERALHGGSLPRQ